MVIVQTVDVLRPTHVEARFFGQELLAFYFLHILLPSTNLIQEVRLLVGPEKWAAKALSVSATPTNGDADGLLTMMPIKTPFRR